MTRNKSIRLSERHGVNPCVPICFLCGRGKNEVLLLGRLLGDAEAPHSAVWDYEPCDKCKALMKQGIMFISVRDGESGDNPFRTGKMCVIKEEVIERAMLVDDMKKRILEKRVAFVEDSQWQQLGLPMHATQDESEHGS